MSLLKSLGNKLQAVREIRGITQEELENKTGINAKYISAIERGQKNATINTLDKIAKGLEIELYELFLFTEKPESEKTARKAINSLLKDADQKTLNLTLEFLKKAAT